jgi:glucose-1-phosphate thymidylyltransferase
MEENIGLIPAAGKGLRLGLPYPKELYPVIRNNHYKPVAQFILENMVQAGIQHIVFVINETKSQLIGYFGNGSRFGCNISYVVQEPNLKEEARPFGLAHALDTAYHLVKGKTVFFGMADTIIQPKEVFSFGFKAMAPEDDAVFCVFPTNSPEKFGMIRSSNQQIVEIVDKPSHTELTNMWGCILWRHRFTEFLHEAVKEKGEFDFAKILNQAIAGGYKFHSVIFPKGKYLDLGTYEEIMEIDKRLRAD